jgi:predicted DNA-binding transcriptional regulator AlpA
MEKQTISENQIQIIGISASEWEERMAARLSIAIKEALNSSRKEDSPKQSQEIPIDIREGASLLGIALPTMYSKISKREFSSFKRGKKVYVLKSELLNYLKAGKRKSRQEIINHIQ